MLEVAAVEVEVRLVERRYSFINKILLIIYAYRDTQLSCIFIYTCGPGGLCWYRGSIIGGGSIKNLNLNNFDLI